MRTFSAVKPLLMIMCVAMAASAAGITGNWKADLQTPQGTVQVSYSFKQDGETLTGTWQAANSPRLLRREDRRQRRHDLCP